MNTINLNENAKTVLKTRYLLPGETPENLFERVATAIAEPEKDKGYWKDIFYSIMSTTKFLPNSPTLFNAGTGQGTLSACFVIPVQDNMSSIMHAATTSAMIQKFGGGIGYSFSNLRSRGKKIATTHGKACGSVAVLKMMSSLSDMITQGGKRHGANMGILGIDHPEIIDFIHMKDDDQTAQNFNISVELKGKHWQSLLLYINKAKQGTLFHINYYIDILYDRDIFMFYDKNNIDFNKNLKLSNKTLWYDTIFTVDDVNDKIENKKYILDTIYCPENIINKGLYIGHWRYGDAIINNKFKRKVSDIFINNKISICEKKYYPIIKNYDDEILWIPKLSNKISQDEKIKKITWYYDKQK